MAQHHLVIHGGTVNGLVHFGIDLVTNGFSIPIRLDVCIQDSVKMYGSTLNI